MTRRSVLPAVLLACAALFAMPRAQADTPPTRWDRVRDPRAEERFALHVLVRELMQAGDRQAPPLRTLNLERARTLLEDAGAATSPDVRLRFDLGEIYEYLSRHAAAIAVLQPALDAAPDHPAASEAWIQVAYAYSHLDRSREEKAAYTKYIHIAPDDGSRVTAMYNAAEAEMRLGHLEDAVAGYRDAMAYGDSLSGSLGSGTGWETSVLSEWGLAVALDRAGDPAGAVAAARHAAERDPQEYFIGNRDHVFFVPEYDRYWYLALGRAERAKQASDPRKALAWWRLTEQCWSRYVAQAQNEAPAQWLALARAHLDQTRTARQGAERRAAGKRPLPQLDPQLDFVQ